MLGKSPSIFIYYIFLGFLMRLSCLFIFKSSSLVKLIFAIPSIGEAILYGIIVVKKDISQMVGYACAFQRVGHCRVIIALYGRWVGESVYTTVDDCVELFHEVDDDVGSVVVYLMLLFVAFLDGDLVDETLHGEVHVLQHLQFIVILGRVVFIVVVWGRGGRECSVERGEHIAVLPLFPFLA